MQRSDQTDRDAEGFARGRLIRLVDDGLQTFGTLIINNFPVCVTLEPAWKNNLPARSCIPAGTYMAELKSHEEHGPILHITPVEGRDPIYIHIGNWRRQTQGCILPGKYFKVDQHNDEMVVSSADAMKAIIRAMRPHTKMILIIEEPVMEDLND